MGKKKAGNSYVVMDLDLGTYHWVESATDEQDAIEQYLDECIHEQNYESLIRVVKAPSYKEFIVTKKTETKTSTVTNIEEQDIG